MKVVRAYFMVSPNKYTFEVTEDSVKSICLYFLCTDILLIITAIKLRFLNIMISNIDKVLLINALYIFSML